MISVFLIIVLDTKRRWQVHYFEGQWIPGVSLVATLNDQRLIVWIF